MSSDGFRTVAEIKAYNAGVFAVLKIAHDAAEAIHRTTKRPVHEGFAIASLAELVDAGKALLIPLPAATVAGVLGPSVGSQLVASQTTAPERT